MVAAAALRGGGCVICGVQHPTGCAAVGIAVWFTTPRCRAEFEFSQSGREADGETGGEDDLCGVGASGPNPRGPRCD